MNESGKKVDDLARRYVEAGRCKNYREALGLVKLEKPELWAEYEKTMHGVEVKTYQGTPGQRVDALCKKYIEAGVVSDYRKALDLVSYRAPELWREYNAGRRA